jgi:hypothetical protein
VKKQLSAEEAYDRLKEEIEVVSECAEGHVEDAAYWWSRVVGSKAEVVGETLRVDITPFVVQQVISTLLEERLDECFGDPIQLAELWTDICPHEAQVNRDGLLVEDDE